MKKILAKVLILLMVFNLGGGVLPNLSHAVQLTVDTSLQFDFEPYVAQQTSEHLVVQFKVSRASTLYYQAVPTGTAVTNESVISNDTSKAFQFGATSYIKFDSLQPEISYDLCFVLTDPEHGNIAASVPFKLTNQHLTLPNPPEPNGIQSATYANGPAENGAHIYVFLEAPSLSETPIAPAVGDVSVKFSGSITGNPGERILTSGEYTIAPIYFGSRIMDIWIIPETFVSGTLSDYSLYGMGAPGTFEVAIVNTSVFNPAISENLSLALPITETLLMETTLPVMYPKHYVEDAGQDYILFQLDREVPIVDLPAIGDLGIATIPELPQNSVLTMTPIEVTTDSAISFKVEFDSVAETFLRTAGSPSFNVSYTPSTPTMQLVTQPSNPYFINSNFAGSESINEIESIQLFEGTQNAMTATRQPNSNNFTVIVPYVTLLPIAYEQLISGVRVNPSSPYSYVETNKDSGLCITVTALNGTTANYMLNFIPDPLTLGGISFGGTVFAGFNPFQNHAIPYQIVTSTVYTLETLPALTVLYDSESSIQCSISNPVAIQGTGNFDYTITLSDGLTTPTTRTYHVYVIYYSGASSVVTDHSDRNVGTNTALPSGLPAGIDPSQIYDPFKFLTTGTSPTADQILSEVNKLKDLMASAQLGSLDSAMKNFDTLFKSVTNSEQAFSTLGAMDGVLGKITFTQGSTAANANAVKLAESLTYNTESKLMLIKNPNQQLEVLTKFVDAAKILQGSSTEPLVLMNQSIGEMLQKTANNFGTTQMAAPEPGKPLVVEGKAIQDVIAKQAEGLKALNDLQQKFFDAGNQQALKPEIKLEVQPAEGSKQLEVSLPQEAVDILKAQKIDAIAISSQHVEIKVPVSDLKPSENAQIVIEQRTAPVLRVPLPEPPYAVYEFSMLVNNSKQETFSKPITLSFELAAFGFAGELGDTLVVGRYNDALQVWQPVGGIVDPQSGVIFAKRDNLSQYTVLKSKKSFSDADNSWAKEEINAMLNKGIVSDASSFKPQSMLTRGEFAQWIANAYGLKVSEKSLPFKDVPKNSEYYSAIAAVYQQGILQGSKDKFNPDKALTQNELAAALGKVLVSFDNKQKSDKVTSKHLAALKTTQVASWAEDDMALLMELGMAVNAKSGSENITKEAAASAFMKFYRS